MGKSKAQLVTVALEWFLNPDHLPIVAAKEKGFFREEGLAHADIVPVDVGFALTDALISGNADAVFGAFVNYEQVEAEMKGASVEFVSPTQYDVPDMYQLVVMTADRMVRSKPEIVRKFVRGYTRGLAMV